MIFKYMRERLAWILLILCIQMLLVIVAIVDPLIPLPPVLYMNLLSFIILVIFLVIRYQIETRFYRSLIAWDDTYDMSTITEPASPFEAVTMQVLSHQSERYRTESSKYMLELEQEKDDLLSWIHEVKTPLTTMKLIIERIPDETLKSQMMYEWLRIHLLLDQQLHQKRILFIENDIHMEITALEPLIYTEIKTLKSWCLQKGIGFDVTLDCEEVLTDAKWLGFILRQLLSNAVKYSEQGDIEIHSEVIDGQVHVRIQDYGRGIDRKDLPRIFDKGFTSTSAQRDTAATGMGLYLAKKAADSLLIRILVDSTLSKGTAVTLVFPKKNEFVSLSGV